MYIKDDKANKKALDELDKLIDQNPDVGTPERKRLVTLSNAIVRYERWMYDDGAPHRWILQMPESWTRPSPAYDPKQSNHERLLEQRMHSPKGLKRHGRIYWVGRHQI